MASLSQFTNSRPVNFKVGPDETETVVVLTDALDFIYAVEHVSPDDWRKSALCTYDEGQCYGCDQAVYGWNQKIKVYIPVSHNGELKFWGQGIGINSGLWPILDNLPTKNKAFDITRSGNGKRTKYTAIPVDIGDSRVYTGRVAKVSLTANIAYEKQSKYYN